MGRHHQTHCDPGASAYRFDCGLFDRALPTGTFLRRARRCARQEDEDEAGEEGRES